MLVVTFVVLYSCGANLYYTRKLMPEVQYNRYKEKAPLKLFCHRASLNSVNEPSTVLLTTLDLFLANLLAGSLASGSYSVAKTVPNFVQSIISYWSQFSYPNSPIYFAQHKQKEMTSNISFSIKFM